MASDAADNPKHRVSKKPSTPQCPICDDPVRDTVGNRKGHDAIYCDGLCKEWIHRQCAGLSKATLSVLAKSSDAFYCPKCTIAKQASDINELKESISVLKKDVEGLKSLVMKNEYHSSAAATDRSPDHLYTSTGSSDSESGTPMHTRGRLYETERRGISSGPSRSEVTKKKNLILLGISEQECGSRRRTRLAKDYQSVSSVCKFLLPPDNLGAPSVTSALVGCRRLGKFDSSRKTPRPLLANFSNSLTPSQILTTKSTLATDPRYKGVTIKPDLSHEKRKEEQLLLKERRRLLESGIAKNMIRIRRGKIIVDSKLHGSIIDGELKLASRCSTPSAQLYDYAVDDATKSKSDARFSVSHTSSTDDLESHQLVVDAEAELDVTITGDEDNNGPSGLNDDEVTNTAVSEQHESEITVPIVESTSTQKGNSPF